MGNFKVNWGAIVEEDKNKKKRFVQDERLLIINSQVDKRDLTLRIIPPKDTDLPWVTTNNHFVKDRNGVVYSEKCLDSIGKKCPVCRFAWDGWIKGSKNNPRKPYTPNQKWTVNVLVLKDSTQPENVGKIFLFSFGRIIWKQLEELMADDIYPWDYEDGRNLKIKIRVETVEGKKTPKWDGSSFSDDSTALGDGTQDDWTRIVEEAYSLADYNAESTYKKYDVMKAEFDSFIGFDSGIKNGSDDDEVTAPPTSRPPAKKAPVVEEEDAPPTRPSTKKPPAPPVVAEEDDDAFTVTDDDDPNAFFENE